MSNSFDKNSSNEHLLQAYQKSDLKAFEEFYRRNSKLLYNYILSKTRNQTETDDAMQETFFRIHKYVMRFDPKQSALAWSFQIARNVLIDLYNKNKKHHADQYEDISSVISPHSAVAAKLELEKLLLSLTPKERDLILNRFVESDSFEEIAEQLKTSPANVRQKLSRILRKIRSSS